MSSSSSLFLILQLLSSYGLLHHTKIFTFVFFFKLSPPSVPLPWPSASASSLLLFPVQGRVFTWSFCTFFMRLHLGCCHFSQRYTGKWLSFVLVFWYWLFGCCKSSCRKSKWKMNVSNFCAFMSVAFFLWNCEGNNWKSLQLSHFQLCQAQLSLVFFFFSIWKIKNSTVFSFCLQKQSNFALFFDGALYGMQWVWFVLFS